MLAIRLSPTRSVVATFVFASSALANDGGSDAAAPRIDRLSPQPGTAIVGGDGLNHVEVEFDKPVNIPAEAVRAWGLRSGNILTFSKSYDPQANVLAVTFAPPVRDDRLTIVIDYSITDAAGNELDGEISNPANAVLPSGNGQPGGQAVFRFHILQGDANRDGVVDKADGAIIQSALGQCIGDPGHDPNADLNGDGCINVVDVNIFSEAMGRFLPTTDGIAPTVVSIVPAPTEPFFAPLGVLTLDFSEPIHPDRFDVRTCFVLDQAGILYVPTDASLSSDGLSATYIFNPPLSQCAVYSINISNAFSDPSGSLLAPPQTPPSISGLRPPPVASLAPHATMTNEPSVEITGTAPGGDTIEIAVLSGPITSIPVSAGAFSANVALGQNRVNQLFVTSVSACGIRSAPKSAAITHDNQPPSLFIDFPPDGAQLTNETTDVAGRVGDLLSGFMGLTVVVNGVPAVVDPGIGTNGTFLASGVPLTPDVPTTIEATATDELGNTAIRRITVTRITIPPDAPQMAIVAGNRQTGQIGTALSDPIVVRLTRGDGTPFVNKVVTFDVTRSNGRLSAELGSAESMMLQVRTDADGEARAFWRLGDDAGCGNNRVEATSKDIAGTIAFCASGIASPATQINVSSGNNQRAEAGGPGPEPLKVWVSDGRNGVPNVPVTFTVIEAGGQVNGQDAVTIETTNTGHAQVNLTLGPEAGINGVEATFPGNPGLPATFLITGVPRVENRPTRFSGIVLDNASRPIGGAKCTLQFAGQPDMVEYTNEAGQFRFENVTGAGPADLFVDGAVATTLNGQPVPQGSFPFLHYTPVVIPNADNGLPTPVLLPPLNPNNARQYSTTRDTILTVEEIKGLRMIVKAGSMQIDGVPATDGQFIALNQVHYDDIPMPMPDGAAPPFAWTLQPAGATFDPPVAIEMPNMSGLPPGAIMYFLSFDHDTNRFEIVASGHVTSNGALLKTDLGAGISTAGWGGFCPPYPNTTTVTGQQDRNHRCSETAGFIKSTVEAVKFIENPCILDDLKELKAWHACRIEAVRCVSQMARNACGVPGATCGVPIPTTGWLEKAEQILFVLREIFELLGGRLAIAAALDDFSVEVVAADESIIPTEIPAVIANTSAVVTFTGTLPSVLQAGDAHISDQMESVGIAPLGAAQLRILDIVGNQLACELVSFEPEFLPQGKVTVAAQTGSVDALGGFSVPNVPATAGTIIRPIVSYSGVGAEALASPRVYLEPVSGGVTDFGIVPIEPEPFLPSSISATATQPVLEVGQQSQIVVSAVGRSGELRDVTSRSMGTVYQSSNPTIGSIGLQGGITAQNIGTVFVTAINEGATATDRIEVVAETCDTTVEGFVQGSDGAPVEGAAVTVLIFGGLPVFTDEDGFFSFPLVISCGATNMTVTVEHSDGAVTRFATKLVSPVVDGITDAGILTLETLCELEWSKRFGPPGCNGNIHALKVFDDGSGLRLYVGGEFSSCGGVNANRIARWDGIRWSAVGNGFASGSVLALSSFDDGTGTALFAGGDIPGFMAKWNGDNWSAVADGPDDTVRAFAEFNDGWGRSLFIGGNFLTAGGVQVNRIVKWDGQKWTALGPGLNLLVSALAVFNDGTGEALYAGGAFTRTADTEVVLNRIGRWDGENWSPVGSGFNGLVRALAVYDADGPGPDPPVLYAAGDFVGSGDLTTVFNRIARWDGKAWSELAGGVGGPVYNVFEDGMTRLLYVGGSFTTAGGTTVNRIAGWDGEAWTPLHKGMNGDVRAIASFTDELGHGIYAAGFFTGDGEIAGVGRIARWQTDRWSALGAGLNGDIWTWTVWDDGSGPTLFVGGDFSNHNVLRVGKWDGTRWLPLGGGMNGRVRSFALFDDGTGRALYAGGDFSSPCQFLAKWNGTNWTCPGGGLNSNVRDFRVFDDGTGLALYAATRATIQKWNGQSWSQVGGGFTCCDQTFLSIADDGTGNSLFTRRAFTSPCNRIAKWDGFAWSCLASGLNSPVHTVISFDDGTGPAIYVGGDFSHTGDGSRTLNRIAKWDGADWFPVGGGMNSSVFGLGVLDDGTGPALYARGSFTSPCNRIAQWDGTSWSCLGTGCNSNTHNIIPFNDGTGTAFYVTGAFSSCGGVPANYIAKWDAEGWSAVDGGLFGSCCAGGMARFDDGFGEALYVAGQFNAAGGAPSVRIARWGCAALEPVIGDCNQDRRVNLDDYSVFHQCFEWDGKLPADCACADRNGDDAVNLRDYSIFQNGFAPAQ